MAKVESAPSTKWWKSWSETLRMRWPGSSLCTSSQLYVYGVVVCAARREEAREEGAKVTQTDGQKPATCLVHTQHQGRAHALSRAPAPVEEVGVDEHDLAGLRKERGMDGSGASQPTTTRPCTDDAPTSSTLDWIYLERSRGVDPPADIRRRIPPEVPLHLEPAAFSSCSMRCMAARPGPWGGKGGQHVSSFRHASLSSPPPPPPARPLTQSLTFGVDGRDDVSFRA